MPDFSDRDPACRLMAADSTVITDSWSFSLRDPFWRFYCNDEPGAVVIYPNGRHDLQPGRLHLIPAWGDFRANCAGQVTHHYVHVDAGDWGTGYFSRPIALEASPERLAGFHRLASGEAWTASGRLRLRALALECLAEALERLPPAKRQGFDLGRDDDPSERARRFMAQHLAAPLTLEELADRAGVSSGHLNHCFKQRHGQSCMAYLRERRVAAAAERLLLGEATIDTIAEDLGFANRYHFSRIFSRVTGMGPAAYRRQHRR